MSSRRLQGLEPQFLGLPQNRRRGREEILPSTNSDDLNVLSSVEKKPRPTSEPIVPVSIPATEVAIPLSKDDILRILSKEMPVEKASIIESFMRRNNIKNQQVPSIYSSYFFRKDIIKEFQKKVIRLVPSEKLSSFPLSTYNLYNKDDVLNNTTYRPDLIGSRIVEKNSRYTKKSKENMKQFIEILSKNICSSIEEEYVIAAVKRAIDLVKNEKNFDILIASTRVIEDVSLPIERRLEGVVAFVIVELGECKKYPSAYSINLICTDLNKAISGTGSILMGAFLYTILSHPNNTNPNTPAKFPDGKSFLKVTSKRLPDGRVVENCTFGSDEDLIPVQQIAVLELALAYNNPGGLCMYEKFGFTYDQTMYSDNAKGITCFDDRDNLPMLIDFTTKPGYSELNNEERKDKVVKITVGINKGFSKSKICSVSGEDQRLLGMLKSIKLYIDNELGSSLDDFLLDKIQGPLLKQIKQMHQVKGSRMSATQPAKEGTIDEVINYIENPPTPDDPIMRGKIDLIIKFLPKKIINGGNSSRKLKKTFNKSITKNYH
jgi:hypothetical protein